MRLVHSQISFTHGVFPACLLLPVALNLAGVFVAVLCYRLRQSISHIFPRSTYRYCSKYVGPCSTLTYMRTEVPARARSWYITHKRTFRGWSFDQILPCCSRMNSLYCGRSTSTGKGPREHGSPQECTPPCADALFGPDMPDLTLEKLQYTEKYLARKNSTTKTSNSHY